MKLTNDHIAGRKLYGDDFTPEEIAQWYRDEEYGYFDLASGRNGSDLLAAGVESRSYEYEALNSFHGFHLVEGNHFETCLAFGCAGGDDVAPIAPYVGNFLAVEPAEQWWSSSIAGKPAKYLKPSVMGDLEIPDGSVDLITSLGVLHHIPNVSRIFSEFARILRADGMLIIREPISAMGDWRRPRHGLTKHERGLPLMWIDSQVKKNGFSYVRRRFCMFPLTYRLKAVVGAPFNNKRVVELDWLLSTLTSWNYHYWRNTAFKKFAPGSLFVVLRRHADDQSCGTPQ